MVAIGLTVFNIEATALLTPRMVKIKATPETIAGIIVSKNRPLTEIVLGIGRTFRPANVPTVNSIASMTNMQKVNPCLSTLCNSDPPIVITQFVQYMVESRITTIFAVLVDNLLFPNESLDMLHTVSRTVIYAI